MTKKEPSFREHGRDVVALEAKAVAALADRIDEGFVRACELILECKGRVIIVGVGKSGHIGGKIAATLASTGTPAFFVHPGEASHGDLGMITPEDIVLAISNSGESKEILTILPIIKRMGVKLIALTGNTSSSLTRQADASLDVSVEKEACPMNLSPTASTTAALAMGDAIAVALLRSRNFTREDFAGFHPGGLLGRRLLIYVEDIMHTGEQIPVVTHDASLQDALLEMTSKGLGMTGVVDKQGCLCGIYTDGDLRRTLNQGVDVYKAKINDVMTHDPTTIGAGRLAHEAVQLIRQHNFNGLYVVDSDNHVLGALNMQVLLRAGIV
ncbi:MAG: KpsF/GutQ family sugar-phosphate isomerase [Gammaproteobacteria bacterium]|nr:KpsF/GutQ family sugar-phosphate isomerase [Gammaproteobacteria bacterium]